MIVKRTKKAIYKLLSLVCGVMLVAATVVSIITPQITYAVCDYDEEFYSSNDIMFYNPCDDGDSSTCTSTGITLGVVSDVTKQKAEAAQIKQKAEANMEIYKYAAEQTGVPWQIIAALHYREAGMDPNRSMADGSALSAGESMDNLPIYSDAKTDAADKTAHFIAMAASVYGLNADSLSKWSVDDWGEAFLAYNRGNNYKIAKQSYTLSPYVMNYIDKDHENMAWTKNDSYFNGSTTPTNNLYDDKVKDESLGALAVANYLGLTAASGDDATASGSGNCGGNGAVQNDIVQTAINLSWPTAASTDGRAEGEGKPEYIQAMKDVGTYGQGCSGLTYGSDCSIFVTTVMRSSGVDPDFPMGTWNELKYLPNSPDYERIENIGSTSNMQPGDILIIAPSGSCGYCGSGHVLLYIGDSATDGGKNAAEASCNEYSARRSTPIYFEDGRGKYEIYRHK